MMIAGDGYVYLIYEYASLPGCPQEGDRLYLLRVNSSGAYDNIKIASGNFGDLIFDAYMITNADQGVLLSWQTDGWAGYQMAVTTGTSVSVVNAPQVPGQVDIVQPVLQAQDGSFVGVITLDVSDPVTHTQAYDMVAFDAAGNVRWIVPNDWPQIATADGGVIGASGIAYDANGNAAGSVGSLPAPSWTGNWYRDGDVRQVSLAPAQFAFSYAAIQGANPSGSNAYVRPLSAPQLALYALATANLTATPQCSALLTQFANVARVPEATLLAQLQATARRARDFVYDGPSSSTPLDPAKFPGAASPGVATVGEWFGLYDVSPYYAEGFSQFNGYAVWFRLSDWQSWIKGWFSGFLITSTGNVNYYAMGTVMHEILHKQAVGGGFTHNQPPDSRDMGAAISAVGWPSGMVPDHNALSAAFGLLCFPGLK
jgi:hypothetical protein